MQPYSVRTGGADRHLMRRDDRLCHDKPNARSTGFGASGCVGTVKPPEQLRLVTGCESLRLIADPKNGLPSLFIQFYIDRTALRRVLGRILQ